jgi:hypothetical protein
VEERVRVRRLRRAQTLRLSARPPHPDPLLHVGVEERE